MTTYFNVTGTYPALAQGQAFPTGTVTLTPYSEVADGIDIAAAKYTVIPIVGGVVTPTEMLYVAGIAYKVFVRLTGAADQYYSFTPTGADVDLSSVPRAPIQAGVVGPTGPVGPAGSPGAAGATPTVSSNSGILAVSTAGIAVTLDYVGDFVRQTGAVAATADPTMVPSQGPPTTARPIFMPVTVEAATAAAKIWTAYVADTAGTAPTLPTATFMAVYDATTGVLLGQTGDLSSLFTAVQATVIGTINAPGTSTPTPITFTKGQKIVIMLLMSYTGATASAPQILATRLFGANVQGAGGITPRVLVNTSGSTFTTVPTAIAPAVGGIAIQASNSNPIFAVVLSTS